MKNTSPSGLLRLFWVIVALPIVSACGDAAPDSDEPLVPSPQIQTRPAVAVYSFGADSAHPPLRNQPGPDSPLRATGITVMSGDRIELKPSSVTRGQRQALPPQVFREDHLICTQYTDVCIAHEPIHQRQCQDHCSLCIKCDFPLGCLPKNCCDTVCQDVHVGDRCVASQKQCSGQQNQWIETATFLGLGPEERTRDAAPMNSTALLLSGFKLRFSISTDGGRPKNVDCGLGRFKPSLDAEKITLILQNAEGCPSIFADSTTQASLSLINEMSVPMTYSQGRQIKTWDGRVLEQPQDAVYSAPIDFVGTLSVFSTPPSN